MKKSLIILCTLTIYRLDCNNDNRYSIHDNTSQYDVHSKKANQARSDYIRRKSMKLIQLSYETQNMLHDIYRQLKQVNATAIIIKLKKLLDTAELIVAAFIEHASHMNELAFGIERVIDELRLVSKSIDTHMLIAKNTKVSDTLKGVAISLAQQGLSLAQWIPGGSLLKGMFSWFGQHKNAAPSIQSGMNQNTDTDTTSQESELSNESYANANYNLDELRQESEYERRTLLELKQDIIELEHGLQDINYSRDSFKDLYEHINLMIDTLMKIDVMIENIHGSFEYLHNHVTDKHNSITDLLKNKIADTVYNVEESSLIRARKIVDDAENGIENKIKSTIGRTMSYERDIENKIKGTINNTENYIERGIRRTINRTESYND